MKCYKCKKELGNKNIVEVEIWENAIWDKNKDFLALGKKGKRYYYYKKCLKVK